MSVTANVKPRLVWSALGRVWVCDGDDMDAAGRTSGQAYRRWMWMEQTRRWASAEWDRARWKAVW